VEKPHGIHWTGGWVGLQSQLGSSEKRKFACSYQESNLDSMVTLPVALALYWLRYLNAIKIKLTKYFCNYSEHRGK
jgi:hypothetical protein